MTNQIPDRTGGLDPLEFITRPGRRVRITENLQGTASVVPKIAEPVKTSRKRKSGGKGRKSRKGGRRSGERKR